MNYPRFAQRKSFAASLFGTCGAHVFANKDARDYPGSDATPIDVSSQLTSDLTSSFMTANRCS